LFVVSAALVALSVHLSLDRPWLAIALLIAAVGALIPPWWARRRFRQLLLSGDAERVVEAWQEAAEQGPHSETTTPLVAATAFAAYGWVQEARKHLRMLRPGPAWEASAEHRMFVETMLEAFDGDRDQAMHMAQSIIGLPLPAVSPKLKQQVVLLRAALGALSRAFAHRSAAGDLDVLEHTARTSPLVSWAMRYAAAIIAIDRGESMRAASLLSGAPQWPPQSAFRQFHEELINKVTGDDRAGTPPSA